MLREISSQLARSVREHSESKRAAISEKLKVLGKNNDNIGSALQIMCMWVPYLYHDFVIDMLASRFPDSPQNTK